MPSWKYPIGTKVSASFGGRGEIIAHETYQQRPVYLVKFKVAPDHPHLCLEEELVLSQNTEDRNGLKQSSENKVAGV